MVSQMVEKLLSCIMGAIGSRSSRLDPTHKNICAALIWTMFKLHGSKDGNVGLSFHQVGPD